MSTPTQRACRRSRPGIPLRQQILREAPQSTDWLLTRHPRLRLASAYARLSMYIAAQRTKNMLTYMAARKRRLTRRLLSMLANAVSRRDDMAADPPMLGAPERVRMG
jgi:hypothetical protein